MNPARHQQGDTPQRPAAPGYPDDAGVAPDALISALDQAHLILEFSPDGKLVAANRNFLELTGYDLPALLDKHHDDLFPVDLPRVQSSRFIWANLRSGESRTGEVGLRPKAGEFLWFQACYIPILDARGATTRVVQLAFDQTLDALVNIWSRSVGQLHADDPTRPLQDQGEAA